LSLYQLCYQNSLKNDIPNNFLEINYKIFPITGREIPETASTVLCHKPIKWCTTSELENNKCEWLRQAAIIQGIVPELQCVQGTSHLDCFKKINMTEADIVGTNSDLGPIATQ
jgi:hypothetical protein